MKVSELIAQLQHQPQDAEATIVVDGVEFDEDNGDLMLIAGSAEDQ